MAINFTDFTNANRAQNKYEGISELLPNILEGYKAARTPEIMDTDLDLKKAQIQKALMENQGGTQLQGHARNVSDLNKLLMDPNIPDQQKQLAKALFEADLNTKNSLITTRENKVRNQKFNMLPSDSKINVLSGFAGLDIGESEAIELYNDGYTPGSYAKEALGFNDNQAQQIDKRFPTTSGTRKDIATAEGALAEEEYLAPLVNEAIEPYSQTLFGFSPKQIAESFSNNPKDIDKQSKFLAARALQPEIAGIRSRMTGGSSAHEALKDIQRAALNDIKVFQARVTPEVYKKTQEYISDWISGATKSRTNAMKGQGESFRNNIEQAQQPSGIDVSAVLRAIAERNR